MRSHGQGLISDTQLLPAVVREQMSPGPLRLMKEMYRGMRPNPEQTPPTPRIEDRRRAKKTVPMIAKNKNGRPIKPSIRPKA